MTHRLEAKDIQPLLDRYLDGKTTQQEQQLLAQFFALTVELPENLLPYKEMFELLVEPDIVPSQAAISKLALPAPLKHHTIRLWPWVATACAAGIAALVFLSPPKAQTEHHIAQRSSQVAYKTTAVAPPTETSRAEVPFAKPANDSPKPKIKPATVTTLTTDTASAPSYAPAPPVGPLQHEEPVAPAGDATPSPLLATTDDVEQQMLALRTEAMRYALEEEFKEHDRYLRTSTNVIERLTEGDKTTYIVRLEL